MEMRKYYFHAAFIFAVSFTNQDRIISGFSVRETGGMRFHLRNPIEASHFACHSPKIGRVPRLWAFNQWTTMDQPAVDGITPVQGVAKQMKEILTTLPQNEQGAASKVLQDGLTNVKSATATALSKICDNESCIRISSWITSYFDSVHDQMNDFFQKIHTSYPNLNTYMITESQLAAILSPYSLVALVTMLIIVIFMSTFQQQSASSSDGPYPVGKYNATSSKLYFDNHKWDMISRFSQILVSSAAFSFSLAGDYLSNKLQSNADKRALELSALLTRLGPTFIKVGQSLSIRTDLLSPAYVRGLKALQDQVPPFSSTEAIRILEDELGQPIDDVFSYFNKEPVAAASLGQVYRAKLKSGVEVAVKVQRPNIMNQIALDMHLVREIAPILRNTFNLNTDLADVVDTWGVGFVDELDYISEAENAEYFTESIGRTPLAGVVFAPDVIEEYTTGKVLTTEWILGERLDQSRSEDVSALCSIAMNTYLTMMLETGVLHCDPHPGNLLRTPDGKLCILDWGMVTRLEPDRQIKLIEHVAHLTSGDYAEVPRDLLILGFIPESKADLINDSGIVELLASIYSAWTRGGGAAAINVNQVIAQLQDLTAKKGNLFMIPAYFAYIAKAFSVLEGIGLSNNPKYSIVNECLPYVSKRLLTDKSERTGSALNTFVYGVAKNDVETRVIDYNRVEQLVTGFANYSLSASGTLLASNQTRAELLNVLSEQVFDLLATEDETPLQKIFIEQLAKIVLANSRSTFAELRQRSGMLPSGRSLLGSIVDPLGIFRTSPFVRLNRIDLETVETTRKLINLAQGQLNVNGVDVFNANSLSGREVRELINILLQKIWVRRVGLIKTGTRLTMKLLQLTADKLDKGDRIDGYIPVLEKWQDNIPVPRSVDEFKFMSPRQSSNPRVQEARNVLARLETEQNTSS